MVANLTSPGLTSLRGEAAVIDGRETGRTANLYVAKFDARCGGRTLEGPHTRHLKFPLYLHFLMPPIAFRKRQTSEYSSSMVDALRNVVSLVSSSSDSIKPICLYIKSLNIKQQVGMYIVRSKMIQ